MKYAIVNNNRIQDLNANPSECFHPDVAKLYDTEVQDDVQIGYELVDGVWTAPVIPEVPEPEPEPKVYKQLSPLDFKMCFTSEERIAIKTIRTTDPIIDDAYDILDDPRLQTVDLGLASVQNLIGYLNSLGILTTERRSEILEGKLL